MMVHAVLSQLQALYNGKLLAVIVLALLVHFVIWLKLHSIELGYNMGYWTFMLTLVIAFLPMILIIYMQRINGDIL